MSNSEKHDFRREFLIHDAERKLAERVFSETLEVDWPALGSLPDSCYRLLKSPFKINRCG
jgi:hypothetical protein